MKKLTIIRSTWHLATTPKTRAYVARFLARRVGKKKGDAEVSLLGFPEGINYFLAKANDKKNGKNWFN